MGYTLASRLVKFCPSCGKPSRFVGPIRHECDSCGLAFEVCKARPQELESRVMPKLESQVITPPGAVIEARVIKMPPQLQAAMGEACRKVREAREKAGLSPGMFDDYLSH